MMLQKREDNITNKIYYLGIIIYASFSPRNYKLQSTNIYDAYAKNLLHI